MLESDLSVLEMRGCSFCELQNSVFVLCSQVLRNMFPHTAQVFVYADSMWMDRRVPTKRSLAWISKSSSCDCHKESKILYIIVSFRILVAFLYFGVLLLILGVWTES